MQLREQREAKEREQGAAAELRQLTAVTPQQLGAVQRRTEEHLRNRAETLAAVKKRQADQQTRLEAAQLQAALCYKIRHRYFLAIFLRATLPAHSGSNWEHFKKQPQHDA